MQNLSTRPVNSPNISGWGITHISRAYQRTKKRPRSELLQVKTKTEENMVRYITTFNNQWVQLRGILTRNWNILANDRRVAKHIPLRPQLIAHQAKNLRDRLSQSFWETYNELGQRREENRHLPLWQLLSMPFIDSKRKTSSIHLTIVRLASRTISIVAHAMLSMASNAAALRSMWVKRTKNWGNVYNSICPQSCWHKGIKQ